MSRKKDPQTKYRMKQFRSNGHLYAITADPKINEKGVRISNISIWGRLSEDLAFQPNLRFMLLAPSEKEMFIFPPEWDISSKDDTAGIPGQNPVCRDEDKSLLYGDSYLLDLLASECGLREDLESVFGKERADGILTIAYYWIIHNKSLRGLEAAGRVQWFPARMTLDMATGLARSVTEDEADMFMALRKRRADSAGADWFGVASASLSNYAEGIADSRWGGDSAFGPAIRTGLAVVYDVRTGLPVGSVRLPGSIPDSRTLRLLLEELRSSGFSDCGLILDSAYLCKENLDLLVPEGTRAIFAAKTSDPAIMARIDEALTEEGNIATARYYLPEHGCYARDCAYPDPRPGREALRLCLYMDPEIRGAEEKDLVMALVEERESLESHMARGVAPDESLLRKLRRRYLVETDTDGMVTSWSENGKEIAAERKRCGFLAIVCANMDAAAYPISWVLSKRGMSDLQEKAFMRMKGWQADRHLRTWTESSAEGRFFFQLVALALDCHLRRRFLSASGKFRKQFQTPWDLLDEMRSVRLARLGGRPPEVSELVGKQADIFDEFGLDTPKGPGPGSRRKPKAPKA